MKKFVFDTIVDRENICNLKGDIKWLQDAVHRGDRVVFSGRRNTGKTSLIKSVLIPSFEKRNQGALVLFADLMGVKSIEQINRRIRLGFEQGLSRAKPTATLLKNIAKTIKMARPTMSIDPITGSASFSLGIPEYHDDPPFPAILAQAAAHHTERPILIVLDEFQDIAGIDEAQALMRNSFQQFSPRLSVIILGSKQHLLAKIFADPQAPLASWGRHRVIEQISVQDFHVYINERFAPFDLKIAESEVAILCERMQYVPEPINIVCDRVTRSASGQTIDENSISIAITQIVEERRTLFEERLLRYSQKERTFLTQLALVEPLTQPNSKLFLKRVGISPGSSRPMLNRLLDEAMVFHSKSGYVVGDPLLSEYLRYQR